MRNNNDLDRMLRAPQVPARLTGSTGPARHTRSTGPARPTRPAGPARAFLTYLL